MANPTKFLSTEVTLTTANTVSDATLVRCLNSNTTTMSTITVANSGGTIATFTLPYLGSDESVVYVAKHPTDTLAASGGTIKAVSVAYL
jgi:hypothetical protein